MLYIGNKHFPKSKSKLKQSKNISYLPGKQFRCGSRIPVGGAPTYDFAKFSEKLHEIEKILGGGPLPLDPPLKFVSISLPMPKNPAKLCSYEAPNSNKNSWRSLFSFKGSEYTG